MTGLRGRLTGGAALLGTFVKSPDPLVAEALCQGGLDVLIADLEHSSLGLRELEGIVRAGEVAGVPVLARLGPGELAAAGRVLETGAAGIQLSGVDEMGLARRARAAVQLAPAGTLGLSLSHRAAGFGARGPAGWAARLQREVVVVGQIESRAALRVLPDLLALADGPDAWFLGPMDLSADLGHPGRPDHPDVQAALVAAAEAVRAAGRPLAVFAADEAEAARWRVRGAALVVLGSDLALLAGLARGLAQRWRDQSCSASS